MEHNLDSTLQEKLNVPGYSGCLVANNQGLCVESRGNISPNASGLLVAIIDQASKLEPNSNPPVIALETTDKTCLIYKHEVTGVIYKENKIARN